MLATRGMGSTNLIVTSGMGSYDVTGADVVRKFKGGNSSELRRLERITEIVEKEVNETDYRLAGSFDNEISVKEVIASLGFDEVHKQLKEIKVELHTLSRDARRQLEARVAKQMLALREKKIEELNQQTIAIMLVAIGLED